MYLHSMAPQQKSQLEHQAATLIFEYRYRQMHEEQLHEVIDDETKKCTRQVDEQHPEQEEAEAHDCAARSHN